MLVPETTGTTKKPLRLAVCGKCKAKHWLSGDLGPLESVPCNKCNHPVILPFRIRQFELREIIASGGMGIVYRSFDTTLERPVAIKLLKREMLQDPHVIESFYREARAAAALSHTNIIHIYNFDHFEERPYIVMELADAGSLDAWIERDGRLPELQVLDLGIKMCSALAAALKRGLLHRDIKPANILFNDEGEPKLVDFGLARKTGDDEDPDAPVWGTPYYVAPEKIKREGEDFHSDMYSLGGTLYHALTGHVPFDAKTVEEVIAGHVHTPLTPAHQVCPDITLPTSEALSIAMAKRPEDRFATYDDFRMALEAARSMLLVNMVKHHQPIAPTKEPHRPWWKR